MKKLSVIIGRFQTNHLHEGHLDLIRQVKAMGNPILVLIGTTDATGTDRNPLSFEVRKHLFDTHITNAQIMPLQDMPSDKDWSYQIDWIIEKLGYDEAVIWGGRDNSIEGYYFGKHEIKTIEQVGFHSATYIRKEIAKEPINCPNFRAGIIHHVENRYPIVYSTVDIAIYCLDYYGIIDSVLMGKKGDKFHFIGGFVDPQDSNIEEAAKRELFEETGFKNLLIYEFSHKIDDSRYKGSKDSIMTHLFSCLNNKRIIPDFEQIPDKEFKEFKWIDASKDSVELIAPCHQELFLKFIN